MIYRPPFPWFGGKSKIAPLVWDVFGDVEHYIEPFFGAGHVLFNRPDWHEKKVETINDADMYVANFWRAVKYAPEEVTKYADDPSNECDLTAKHIWLVQNAPERLARLQGDPDYFDAKVAGWWVWGVSAWMGGGFCSGRGFWTSVDGKLVYRKKFNGTDGVCKKRIDLSNVGRGVLRHTNHLNRKRNDQCELVFQTDDDIVPENATLKTYMKYLAARLRFVRVCCGDWSRIVTDNAMYYGKTVGVLLDPPYGDPKVDEGCYNLADPSISQKVRQWCVEHSNDSRIKICLCGYEGEHNELEELGWVKVEWTAQGGYSNCGDKNNPNRFRERLWFSPNCKENVECLKEQESKNCTRLC